MLELRAGNCRGRRGGEPATDIVVAEATEERSERAREREVGGREGGGLLMQVGSWDGAGASVGEDSSADCAGCGRTYLPQLWLGRLAPGVIRPSVEP